MRILKEDETLHSLGRTSKKPAKGNCIPLAPAPHSAKTIVNVEDLLKKPYLNEFEVEAVPDIAVSILRIQETIEKVKEKPRIVNISELLKKPYLNEVETAAITGRALSTLRNDRFLRRGLPYLKVGKRSIRYKLEDVFTFMEGRRVAF